MSAPHALIEFFQQEAVEYLDRLEQLLAASDNACPDPTAFLTHARALRGSAAMTRLEGLADLALTVERIAGALRDNELRWDQRLHFAVRGALAELRDLVTHANRWSEHEQRRSRTQSVALAAVATGSLAGQGNVAAPVSAPVVPISRFFPDDGLPGVLERNPNPPYTLPQRFRSDIASSAMIVGREAASLMTSDANAVRTRGDGVRRALLGLSGVAESYGATSIGALAVAMARAPLEAIAERTAVQSLAHLLQDRARNDQELAVAVKDATVNWPGRRTPSAAATSPRPMTPVPPRLVIRDMPTPVAAAIPLVPIESLLYSGTSALERARTVRDDLRKAWTDRVGVAVDPVASALLDELSDLLDLAVTR